MAAFKAFSLWFPADRQASLTGWIMTSGGLGALAASAPLEAALRVTGWREIFFALAGLTLAVAFWLFVSVPERGDSGKPASRWPASGPASGQSSPAHTSGASCLSG
jgi:predicted MFS family arabinose efflux permease